MSCSDSESNVDDCEECGDSDSVTISSTGRFLIDVNL